MNRSDAKKFGARALLLFAAVAMAAVASAYEVPVGGDFAETLPDGFPAAWCWFDYQVYLPHAEANVERVDGGNALHYFGAKGARGSALRSRKRIPGKAGELVTVALEAKGRGKAWFSLYCWGEKGEWTLSLSSREIVLQDVWEERSFTFTLVDTATSKAASFEVALGLKPGADAWFRNVRVVRRLEIDRVLESDDYESDAVRPGSPELVRGDIAPGLLAPTRKGVYRTTRRVDIVPATHREMPSSGEFLTSGVRLYGFGKGASGRLETEFAAGGGKFLVTIAPGGEEIACRFSGGGRFAVPATALPADFVFSVAADGTFDLSVTSLANSQTSRFGGEADFFRGATNGVRLAVALLSPGGKAAEATVDNVFLAVSRPERQAQIAYPYTARPQPEFDPAKAGWPLVFSDEFDGSEVDRSKWELPYGKTMDYAKVENGILRIAADYSPDNTNKLVSTDFRSIPRFLYGYFESRLKFTTFKGWWASFWLCSCATANSFLDGCEIDIFEDYYMRNPAHNVLDHNLHIRGSGPIKSWNYNSTLPGTYRDWYTIGCKWTPFEITYYMNGKAIKSSARHSPYETVTFDAFRHGTSIKPLSAIVSGVVPSSGSRRDNDPSEVFPEYYDVDYVRVYGYPGSAPGAAPEVSLSRTDGGRAMTMPMGSRVALKAAPCPAAKTDAKIKAVHLFDSGYYICTKTEPPYEFTVALTDEYFRRTAWYKPGRSGARPDLDGSLHAFSAFAEDESGAVGHSPVVTLMISPGGDSRPFCGEAARLPGVVKVGRYDEGGQGVAYFDSTKGNKTSKDWRHGEGVDCTENSVGAVTSGEWIKYTVDIAKAGRYRVKFPYGTPANCDHWVDLLLDDEKIGRLGPLERRMGHDWSADKVSETEVELPAGRHVLTLHLFGQFNFGNIEVVFAKSK